MGELEELASKAERRRVAGDAARAREAQTATRKQEAYRDSIYADSIGPDAGMLMVMMGLVLAVGGGSVVAVLAPGSIPLWCSLAVGIVVVCVLGRVVLRRGASARFDRWLTQLPFAFDRDGYRTALSREHSSATVTVSVRFAGGFPVADRPLLEASARGALPGSAAHSTGNDLVITSPRLDTKFYAEEVEYHHNRKVHRWVQRCFARALRPIHARHPIEAVDVRVT